MCAASLVRGGGVPIAYRHAIESAHARRMVDVPYAINVRRFLVAIVGGTFDPGGRVHQGQQDVDLHYLVGCWGAQSSRFRRERVRLRRMPSRACTPCVARDMDEEPVARCSFATSRLEVDGHGCAISGMRERRCGWVLVGEVPEKHGDV